MGCGKSSGTKTRQLTAAEQKKLKKLEVKLLIKLMKFELNLDEDPELPVEGRFTLENTNDLGEPLIPATSTVIFAEFKKFLYLVVIKIMRMKRMNQIQVKKLPQLNGLYCYKSPYQAPPYLDSVWRLMILHSKEYNEFCLKMLGGLIEREEPRENLQSAFLKYDKCFKECQKRKDTIKPFGNLWPIYNSPEEFNLDTGYTCYMNNELLPAMMTFFTEHIVTLGIKAVEV